MTTELSPETLVKLETVVTEAWNRPFYREHWKKEKLEDVLQLVREGRVAELPILQKQHVRSRWDDLISLDDIVDITSSSGTTGRPADIPMNREEERLRVEVARRWLDDLGVKPGSRVLLLFSLNDLFSFGVIAWQAIKAQGACAIRVSIPRVDRILQVIEYLKPQFVIGNAFPMVRLAEEAGPRWPDVRLLPKRALLSAASSLTPELDPAPVVARLRELWGLEEVLSTYGSSETGVIGDECTRHQGMHVQEDFSLVEIIDPATQQRVTDPERGGEVVVTGLTLPRSFVPIRYSTGDIVPWYRTGTCACGRKTMRLGPVIGRSDHHLKVTGQTVYPDLLLSLADGMTGVRRSAVRVKSDAFGGDDVVVLLVAEEGHDPKAVEQNATAKFTANLAVSPRIEIITQAELSHLEEAATRGSNQVKIPRFFDLRQK